MSQNSDEEHKKLLIQQRQLSNQQMELSNQMLQQILSQQMFNPINTLPTPIIPTKVPNVGTSSGNLIKQTKIGWKVSNLNFGINQDDSICLSIKLEKSAKINEIDKQKVKATLDSIKFIENLIVDNSLNKDEKKNLVLLKQPGPKINIINLNKQQNMLKTVKDAEQNNLKIIDSKPVEQIINLKSLLIILKNLTSPSIQKKLKKKYFYNFKKLKQILWKNFLKHVNLQLNIPKIVKDGEQNVLKIKQLETKIGELTCSNAAVYATNCCTFQSMSTQINEIQINHKKEIEHLRKEFEEKIKFLNCKSLFLPQEINKEENKINNEDVGFVDVFRFKNPYEHVKLEQYALSKGFCNSIEKVNNWELEQVNSQDNIKKDESNSELSNDFDLLEDENGKEKKNNQIGKEEGKDKNWKGFLMAILFKLEKLILANFSIKIFFLKFNLKTSFFSIHFFILIFKLPPRTTVNELNI
uniref:Uncharacterized protein n=1 Tax=Meloidogyne enterolobii TaxID=390850 RepID=A0A6V7UD57_MELEN|nr:unnamed protein product [Meloidogyne enterolobii]